MSVKSIDKGLGEQVRLAKAINGRGVKFGIQAGAGKDPESGADLLDIAIFNEFGTERVPARPAMRDFAEKNADVLGQAMGRMAEALQDGRLDIDAALGQLGTFAEKHQKAHVQQSKKWAEPNAPATVKKKGSDVPLIDDGLMVGAIRYEKV
ncbi:hypothetical protein [Achromobacter arsenitoxydans]|uniref:Phage protein n=1 Tax=Achromobacter arsenitoxydans SY8 TaxID=477184 RepID=H0F9N1_9BURK|nr:hypothetical protein [Achromobacter arsenitoxydans]EHK65296.1 hypothetical protein KYC_17417 [Achromobacter arsenitoxydans SY8]